MEEPIVVWPPETTYVSCEDFGQYYDCTYMDPVIESWGMLMCCPGEA